MPSFADRRGMPLQKSRIYSKSLDACLGKIFLQSLHKFINAVFLFQFDQIHPFFDGYQPSKNIENRNIVAKVNLSSSPSRPMSP